MTSTYVAPRDASFARSRPPLPAPYDPAISCNPPVLSILHPGYEDDREILRFPAYDKREDGTCWVDYNFVLDMCMAMTGHAYERGIFTLGRDANLPAVGEEDGALHAGTNYFFHPQGRSLLQAAAYAVVRSFRDYRFDPSHVSTHWRSAVPNDYAEKDQKPNSCVLRGQPTVEDAHLVPATEWQYWKENRIHRFATQPGPRTTGRETWTTSNLIKLSSDLHKMFDTGQFVFIPVSGKLQCQWIRRNDWMAADLHSRPIRGGCHFVSPEYAYLACVIRVMGLMQEDFLEPGSTETHVLTAEGRTLLMTGFELANFRDQQVRNTSPAKGGSGSRSPQKRSRTDEEYNAEVEADSGVDLSEMTRGRLRSKAHEHVSRADKRKRKRGRTRSLSRGPEAHDFYM